MNGMNGSPSQEQRASMAHGISSRSRTALVAVGLLSWLAGGAASFLSKNGAGAAALVAVGAVCGVLALMGRWPSRISMSGNEFSWDDIKETVNSQIEVAEKSGENSDPLRELKELRGRLDILQRTGSVPVHPAEIYDKSVEAALRRLLPDAEVLRQEAHRNDIADFIVRHQGAQVCAETKWRPDNAPPFGGSTLPGLIQNLPADANALVVVNTDDWRPSATKNVADVLGKRGRIVTWRNVLDDGALSEALTLLIRAGKQ